MYWMVEQSGEKDSWHLIERIVELYGWSLFGQAGSKSLVESKSLFCKAPPRQRKDDGSEGRNLHLTEMLLVSTFLVTSCFRYNRSKAECDCWREIRVEDPDIDECALKSSTQKPFIAMSKRAPT